MYSYDFINNYLIQQLLLIDDDRLGWLESITRNLGYQNLPSKTYTSKKH